MKFENIVVLAEDGYVNAYDSVKGVDLTEFIDADYKRLIMDASNAWDEAKVLSSEESKAELDYVKFCEGAEDVLESIDFFAVVAKDPDSGEALIGHDGDDAFILFVTEDENEADCYMRDLEKEDEAVGKCIKYEIR